MSDRIRRLRPAPDASLPPLAEPEAVEEARRSYFAARDALLETLVSTSLASQMLCDKRMVNYTRLKGMRYEARAHLAKAQRILAGIESAMEAIERTASKGSES